MEIDAFKVAASVAPKQASKKDFPPNPREPFQIVTGDRAKYASQNARQGVV